MQIVVQGHQAHPGAASLPACLLGGWAQYGVAAVRRARMAVCQSQEKTHVSRPILRSGKDEPDSQTRQPD